MKQTVSEIRALLDKLEADANEAPSVAMRVFSGLELPDILRDFVDLLMPHLRPYEVAFYLHVFRQSILETGDPYVRVSKYRLQEGVVKSSYAERPGREPTDVNASLETVRRAISGLEAVGAIRKEGEPNREGTLYRVLLPEEIEVCQKARLERSKREPSAPVRDQEIDYYNVRENRLKVYERDGYKCCYCGKQLTRFTVTLDHVRSVAEGGENSFDNLVTACLPCNSRKNARLLGDFMAES